MRLPPAPPKRARIEIVPMIDAIFFLLVFFMYSSLSMIKLNGLSVALPQTPGQGAAGAKPGPARDAPHLMVDIRASGATAVDGSATRLNALASSVRTRLAARPGAVVVVRAEPGSSMQTLVSTMDALNTVRLRSGARPTVLIATESVDAPDTRIRVPARKGMPRP